MTKKKSIIYLIMVALISFVLGAFVVTPAEDDFCNVSVINLNGFLSPYSLLNLEEGTEDYTSSQDVLSAIEEAEKDPDIKALILSVNSPGGDPVAGEEVANALKASSKPNVAVIRSIGASASYWAASGADRVFASKLSDVGSIGVTMSYLDQVEKNKKEGLNWNELSSVKFKDTGDPSKPLTEEEKAILLSDLNKAHTIFVEEMAKNRNLKVEDVAKISDGRTYLGEEALRLGLVDEIGDVRSAKDYIEKLVGEKVEICQ